MFCRGIMTNDYIKKTSLREHSTTNYKIQLKDTQAY